MTVECCPICHGNGLVSAGFYSHSGDCFLWVTDSVKPEQCRSCCGKGYIVINESNFPNVYEKEGVAK